MPVGFEEERRDEAEDDEREMTSEEQKQHESHIRGMVLLHKAIKTVRVNPAPVSYWGDDEMMMQLFSGKKGITTVEATGKSGPCFLYDFHDAVVEDPEGYASVIDSDGVTGVHACALNGYFDTLVQLVEEGGADPFVQTRSGIDALMMARRRGHRRILKYFEELQSDGGLRLEEIKAMLVELGF